MTNKYYEITAVVKECGTKEVLFGSFMRKECVEELEECKQCWKWDGYKTFKIESRLINDQPDPEIYGEELYQKAVIKALNESKEVTINVSDTSEDYFDLEDSRDFKEIVEACEATDSPVITIFKNGQSIGYMLIMVGYKDESIADYSVNDFMDRICND